jgi:hypothetical protein
MRRREFIISLIGALTVWPIAAHAQRPGAGDRPALSLTAAQRSEIWRALGKRAGKTQEPAGLNVGEVVPDTYNLQLFGQVSAKGFRRSGFIGTPCCTIKC